MIDDVAELNELMEHARAPRVALLEVLRSALSASRGRARAHRHARTTCPRCTRWRWSPPAMGCPQRKLGTVSVIGPVRMDYGARDPHRPRGRPRALALRRGRYAETLDASQPCPAIHTRCSASSATPTRPTDQEGLPPAGARAAPRRQPPRPRRPRRSSRRRPRPTRSSPTPSGARPMTATATTACARGGYAPNFDGFGSISDLFDAFFGGGGGAAAGVGGPRQGGDVGGRVELDLADAAHGREGRGRLRGRSTAASTAMATAPSRARRSRPARAAPAPASSRRSPAPRSARWCAPWPATSAPATGACPTSRATMCRGRGRAVEPPQGQVEVPAGIADGQRIRMTGRGHAGEAGAPAGDLYVLVGVRARRALRPRGRRPDHRWSTSPPPLAALGTTVEVATLDGPTELEVPAGTQPGDVAHVLRGQGMPRCAAAAPATCGWSSTS